MEEREGYKKTKLGWIPEDWDIVRFEDIVKLGKSKMSPKDNGGNKCVELEHIEQKTGRLLGYAMTDCKTSIKTVFERGDILFGKLRPNLKKYCCPDFDGVCSTEIFVFKTIPKADNKFSFNIVQTDGFLNNAISKSFGTKMPRTNWKIIKEYSFPLPPLPEQQKIAEILTTVDEKISSIEERIKQTEQLKKGLMEKLLTEGIGHTEFRDTKIGRIPASWDVFKIGEIGKVKGGKRLPKGAAFANINTGLPYIRAGDLKNGTVLTENVKYLTPSIHQKIKRYTINSSDTYITIVGAYIGDVGIIPPELDGANLTENAAKISELDRVSNLFLAFFLSSNNGKKQIRNSIGEGAQPKLAIYRIENILMPIPDLFEQKQIASILSTVDDKLDILQSKKASYETLKKGLMEQLLTGKRRVKV